MHHSDTMPEDPKVFWEQRYAAAVDRQRGKAGKLLQQKVAELAPGRVLELGCSTGDDSLWLAEQGWRVTAVDLSEHAVATGERLAREAGLEQRIRFLCQDLTLQVPEGDFELVCALYFQSPYDSFPRIGILQTAASRIVSGGHLLLVTHASAPPWANPDMKKHVFPTFEEDWQALALPETDWELVEGRLLSRMATGPQGQQAELQDNLILARRR